MKSILLIIICCFSIQKAESQITKNNWLVGGNAIFSSLKSSKESVVSVYQTNLQISPVIGYFLKDKFAVGLAPSLDYSNSKSGYSNTIINVGPFIRYYFFDPENIINLFAEGSYAYGRSTGKGRVGQNLNTFSFLAGPGPVF